MQPNRTCEVCGRAFRNWPGSPGRFCSVRCKNTAQERTTTPLAKRFWAKVRKADGCWLWTGATQGHKDGMRYGNVYLGGGRKNAVYSRAHRVAWMLTYGEIPPNLFVCHRCDVSDCCRPDHLFLGTHAENMADMSSKNRVNKRGNVGPSNGRARLNHELAATIRTSTLSTSALARTLGVSWSTVDAVRKGITWK